MQHSLVIETMRQYKIITLYVDNIDIKISTYKVNYIPECS